MTTRHAVTRLLLPVALAFSGAATGAEFGDPLGGLTPDERQRFSHGRAAFEEVEVAADGLGPVFNGTSCAECHNVGGTGGGSDRVETRFGTTSGGAFDPLVAHGGSLVQTDGIGLQAACTFVGEVVPAAATIVAHRRSTPLFGLGLVDAVPDATLALLARRQARRHPATAGRPNQMTDVASGAIVVGKFGWKGQVPNLRQFAADAYLNEMGITTPLFPDESCPQGDCAQLACDPVPGVDDDLEDVELFRDFMSFLAPPPAISPRSRPGVRLFARFADAGGSRAEYRGGRVFEQIECQSCHVRSLTTGASPVAALHLRTFRPYSDFLLHDMGSLGDGIAQGQATGGEMRTAPLWGLRLLTSFLHDGRAATAEEAILAHEGQGRTARDRFVALAPGDKAALVAFLHAL